MKKLISIIGGGIMAALLLWVLVVTARIVESSHTFILANDFTMIVSTRRDIEAFDANAFKQESLDGFTIHRGWFYPKKRTALIYSLRPKAVTAMDMSIMPWLFIKACDGTLEKSDSAALSPEARKLTGVIFHELVAHGSDSYCRGKPRTMIHALWPSTPEPVDEPSQNPWKIVRKYWGSDATHPLLEDDAYP